MNDVVDALRSQLDELDTLLQGADEHDLARPSPCAGWSVSDVVLHLAQTNEIATASVRGEWDAAVGMWSGLDDGVTVDDVVGDAVDRLRGQSGVDTVAWWRRTAANMVTAFEACHPSARVRWVVGEMAAKTLATTRLSETWVHTLDVAEGLGRPIVPTARLWHIARLVHRTIPYAFTRGGIDDPGPVRFALDAPDGGDRWSFGPTDAPTIVSGPAFDLCLVAGQRADASETSLTATGRAGSDVLRLMRTFA